MIPMIPEEIQGKIEFKPGDVALKQDVKLTAEEQEIFEKFRDHIRERTVSRMD